MYDRLKHTHTYVHAYARKLSPRKKNSCKSCELKVKHDAKYTVYVSFFSNVKYRRAKEAFPLSCLHATFSRTRTHTHLYTHTRSANFLYNLWFDKIIAHSIFIFSLSRRTHRPGSAEESVSIHLFCGTYFRVWVCFCVYKISQLNGKRPKKFRYLLHDLFLRPSFRCCRRWRLKKFAGNICTRRRYSRKLNIIRFAK